MLDVVLAIVDAGGSEGRWKLKSPSLRLDRVQSTVENSDGGSTASKLGCCSSCVAPGVSREDALKGPSSRAWNDVVGELGTESVAKLLFVLPAGTDEAAATAGLAMDFGLALGDGIGLATSFIAAAKPGKA